MARLLKIKDQVELCEYYEERFNELELSMIYRISIYQVKAILQKFKVPERTDML